MTYYNINAHMMSARRSVKRSWLIKDFLKTSFRDAFMKWLNTTMKLYEVNNYCLFAQRRVNNDPLVCTRNK